MSVLIDICIKHFLGAEKFGDPCNFGTFRQFDVSFFVSRMDVMIIRAMIREMALPKFHWPVETKQFSIRLPIR